MVSNFFLSSLLAKEVLKLNLFILCVDRSMCSDLVYVILFPQVSTLTFKIHANFSKHFSSFLALGSIRFTSLLRFFDRTIVCQERARKKLEPDAAEIYKAAAIGQSKHFAIF